jgi:hypothetical protein
MRWPVRDVAHDRNDLLHDITADAGLGRPSRARRFHPGGVLLLLSGPTICWLSLSGPCFEMRPIPIPSAGKIERPTAVHTVFERPAG